MDLRSNSTPHPTSKRLELFKRIQLILLASTIRKIIVTRIALQIPHLKLRNITGNRTLSPSAQDLALKMFQRIFSLTHLAGTLPRTKAGAWAEQTYA
jgi:hypothetical protein